MNSIDPLRTDWSVVSTDDEPWVPYHPKELDDWFSRNDQSGVWLGAVLLALVALVAFALGRISA